MFHMKQLLSRGLPNHNHHAGFLVVGNGDGLVYIVFQRKSKKTFVTLKNGMCIHCKFVSIRILQQDGEANGVPEAASNGITQIGLAEVYEMILS